MVGEGGLNREGGFITKSDRQWGGGGLLERGGLIERGGGGA